MCGQAKHCLGGHMGCVASQAGNRGPHSPGFVPIMAQAAPDTMSLHSHCHFTDEEINSETLSNLAQGDTPSGKHGSSNGCPAGISAWPAHGVSGAEELPPGLFFYRPLARNPSLC